MSFDLSDQNRPNELRIFSSSSVFYTLQNCGRRASNILRITILKLYILFVYFIYFSVAIHFLLFRVLFGFTQHAVIYLSFSLHPANSFCLHIDAFINTTQFKIFMLWVCLVSAAIMFSVCITPETTFPLMVVVKIWHFRPLLIHIFSCMCVVY